MPGWGKLVYFDTEEYQIKDEGVELVAISKLGTQWKIIHDFKPMELPPGPVLRFKISFWIHVAGNLPFTALAFSPSTIYLEFEDNILFESNQLPKVGEWTRIEIGYEKGENGKLFLTFTVGGKMLATMDYLGGFEFTDVRIGIGANHQDFQPGFIRRLVVLEKE